MHVWAKLDYPTFAPLIPESLRPAKACILPNSVQVSPPGRQELDVRPTHGSCKKLHLQGLESLERHPQGLPGTAHQL